MNNHPFMRVMIPQNPLACLIMIPILFLLVLILFPVIVIFGILMMLAGKRIPYHSFVRQEKPSEKMDDDVIDVDVIHSETETTEKSHDSSGGKFIE